MPTQLTSKQVIKKVELDRLKVGDRLMQDVSGYKGHILLMRGQVVGARERLWLDKKLKEKTPKLAATRYRTNHKTPGKIASADGTVLVKAGELVTDAKLAPLLKEGFTCIEMAEEYNLYLRKNEWPKDKDWHITDYNPAVLVETTVAVNEKGEEVDENTAPKGKA